MIATVLTYVAEIRLVGAENTPLKVSTGWWFRSDGQRNQLAVRVSVNTGISRSVLR